MDQGTIKHSREVGARWRSARRLLWLLPTALGTAVLALQQADVWKDPPAWIIWAAVVVSSVSLLVEAIIEIFRTSKRSGAPYESGDRQKFMSASAAEIHQQMKLPFASIGISLWVVHTPRRYRAPLRWFTGRKKGEPEVFLYRVERFRVADPTPTNEAWSRGRGVIGACVRDNKQVYRDYRPVQKDYPSDGPPLSGNEWKRIRREKRDDGFSQNDFVRMIHRYEQVFAYPITDEEGQVVGCISVDITSDPDADPRPGLNSQPVTREIHRLAGFMRVTAEKLAVRP